MCYVGQVILCFLTLSNIRATITLNDMLQWLTYISDGIQLADFLQVCKSFDTQATGWATSEQAECIIKLAEYFRQLLTRKEKVICSFLSVHRAVTDGEKASRCKHKAVTI